MFGWLSKARARRPEALAPPRVEPGHRIYVIGDVHGCDDLIAAALRTIDRLDAERPPAIVTEILLGDLVDRGPRSRQVIDRVLQPPGGGRRRIILSGNHERVFLQFLRDAAMFDMWREIGGYETIQSYGIARRPVAGYADAEALRQEFAAAVPEAHVALLSGAELMHVNGDYVFVHAGLKPGVALADQVADDLLWIREPFLSWREPFEKHVVHGHTPVSRTDRRSNRTNIDTGSYATGRLTALVLEDDRAEEIVTERRVGGLP